MGYRCCSTSIWLAVRSVAVSASPTGWGERPAGWRLSTGRRSTSSARVRRWRSRLNERADVFALGLLLRDALAGPTTTREAQPPARWRRRNAEVSVGLADIVEKCLSPRPGDRYGSAAALADDLRRHLGDLPLTGVANRSLAERWRKWRRRQPAALSRRLAYIALVAALAAIFGVGQLVHSLGEQLRQARRGQQAAALHELSERVRFRYGADLPAAGEAQALSDKIGTLWNQRDVLLAQGPRTGEEVSEQTVKSDLLDLAITWSELRAGTGDSKNALRILDEALASCGRSRRLDHARRGLAGALSELDRESAHSADEQYELGRAELRSGRFREAATAFQQVLDERPQDFWPNFYAGLCAYRLGQLDDALAAFRICVALAPRSAECYFNRARALEAMGRFEPATRDYSRALALDPRLTPALLNRAVLAYKQGRHDEAIAGLRRALESSADSTSKGQILYNLALAYLARNERAAALASAEEAVALGYHDAAALVDRARREP